MSNVAALITSVAALITAVTGFLGMAVVARRTSPRERHSAAQSAVGIALTPSPSATAEAIVAVHEQQSEARRD